LARAAHGFVGHRFRIAQDSLLADLISKTD
jgi:hypothetical protein